LEQVLGSCGENELVLLAEQVLDNGCADALACACDDEDFGHDGFVI
jgi:hypothetical protein